MITLGADVAAPQLIPAPDHGEEAKRHDTEDDCTKGMLDENVLYVQSVRTTLRAMLGDFADCHLDQVSFHSPTIRIAYFI